MLTPAQFRSQPQYGVNPLNEIFGGVAEFVWNAAVPTFDGAASRFLTPSAFTPTIVNNTKAIQCTGNTTNAILRSGGKTTAQTRITFIAVFTWNSGASNNFSQLLGVSSSNASFRLGLADEGSGSTATLSIIKGGVVVLNSITISSGIQYVVIASHRQDTGEYYIIARPVSGGSVIRNTQTDTSVSIAGDGVYCVGNARLDFSGSWNGTISLALASFTFIPENLAQKLLFNPWQIFAPRPRRIWATLGGANTYTLSVSGGVTLSGSVPLLRERRQVSSGGIQFSGTIPLLRTRTQIPSGGITFGGTAPIVFNAPNIYTILPSGGVVFSGTVPLRRERLFTPSGAVSFSGTAPLIRTRLLAPTGQVTFSGSAPILFIPAGGLPSVPGSRITVGAARTTRIS